MSRRIAFALIKGLVFLPIGMAVLGASCPALYQRPDDEAGSTGPWFSTWIKSYGGAGEDEANAIEQTFDGAPDIGPHV